MATSWIGSELAPKIVLAFAAAVALAAVPAMAPASDTDSDPGPGTSAPIRLLAFLKNEPLTDEERERITTAATAYQSQHPKDYADFVSSIEKLLDDTAGKVAPIQASRRVTLRTNIEKRPAGDPLRSIVDGIDPVIASNDAEHLLLTRATLIGWDRENHKLARYAGVRAPDDFVSSETREIPTTFAQLTSRDQAALVNSDRDVSLLNYVYSAEIKPTDRPKALAEARPYISSPSKFGLPLAAKSQDYFESYVNRTMFNHMFFTQVLMHVDANRAATNRQMLQDDASHQGIGVYSNGMIGPTIR